MKHFKIFVELTRLNKPIGFMLLFWPCAWGLANTNIVNNNLNLFLLYLALFFLGSVLMRSAGCIFNDIVDKDFDRQVARTKLRPIASGKISVERSSIYVLVLCALAFFILIQFNFLTIILGLASMLLAFSYPFMKRITFWPQLFLGLTFNWGVIMAASSINNEISIDVIILYISAIFWTLGYDTIYGAQDMSDDEIIGLKSTAIKFKKNIKFFVAVSYLVSILILLFLFIDNLGLNIFSVLFLFFSISLLYQIKKFNVKNPKSCLKMFKLNNLTGFLLFVSISVINI